MKPELRQQLDDAGNTIYWECRLPRLDIAVCSPTIEWLLAEIEHAVICKREIEEDISNGLV